MPENRAYVIFDNVNIARYEDIQSCYVRLTAAESRPNEEVVVFAGFADVGDAEEPADADALWDVEFDEGAAYEWTIGDWKKWTQYDTPDLKRSLQTVIDRSDWEYGNSVMFIIENNESTEFRKFFAKEYADGAYKAELYVTHVVRNVDLYHDYFVGSDGQETDTRRWYHGRDMTLIPAFGIWNNALSARVKEIPDVLDGFAYNWIYLQHLAYFDGDFDVQIRSPVYENLGLPNSNYIQFRVTYPYGSTAVWTKGLNYSGYNTLSWHPEDEARIDLGIPYYGANAETYFRFRREGTKIYGFYKQYNDLDWVDSHGGSILDSEGHSEQYMRFEIRMYCGYLLAKVNELAFTIDDFIVNSGTLVKI